MKKQLASVALLLALTGGAFAGIPLRFEEHECSMQGMMDMDCCKAALTQKETPEVAAAKLCCALNCAQNGTSSPPGTVRVIPPSQTTLSIRPATGQSLWNSLLVLRHTDRSHGPPESPPAYIRHLALLI
jgi:hypothetical protein